MTHKPAPTSVPIHELIAGRWSPRAYSGEPVSRDALRAVVEAARWAPSAYNMQPWRFLVFDRTADEAAFKRAFATLVPFNQQWNAPAPVLVAVTAHTLNSKGEVNRTAQYDAGAAAMSLVLQAHALGLAAHQMSGFDVQAFRTEFAIPNDVDVLSIISIGQYGDIDK
ncbi:MAG TPA: nitroreductase family protein, partial [Paraburkholderia sp.]